MKKYLILITILLILTIWVLISYLPKINKINNKPTLISNIPVVKGEEISLYNPKDNTFKDLCEGNRIFGVIGNGKYLLCGIGETLYKEDSIGYISGYNLFLINIETKEKTHLLGNEKPILREIQLGKGKIKTIKDGGDIIFLKIHPDEKRIFYVDKNCALWEFNIESKEKKKLTEDWRVVPKSLVITHDKNKIFYSVYGKREIEGIYQDGISIEVLDLTNYKHKIFKEAEKHPDLIGYGAEYGVIGYSKENTLYVELSLSALMTEIMKKGTNRSWSGLLVVDDDEFKIIKEYPFRYKSDEDLKFFDFPLSDFMNINEYSYILGRNQIEKEKISFQNLILAKFKGPELIEVKILKENLFLGFKARFTFDGNIAYEENPDEWVIIDLDGNLLLKLPKRTQPF